MAKKYISKYTGPEIDSGLDNIPKLEGKLTELESKSLYVTYGTNKIGQKLVELYLEGLQDGVEYSIKQFRQVTLTNSIVNRLYIYQGESVVAYIEDSSLSAGILKITEDNDSGISGYAIIRLTAADTTNATGVINSDVVSNIDNSPSIKSIFVEDKIESKQVTIVGMGSTGTQAGVTKIGDVFFNYEIQTLRKCIHYDETDTSNNQFKTIPFAQDALYIYKGEFFKWQNDAFNLITPNPVNYNVIEGYSLKSETPTQSELYSYSTPIHLTKGQALHVRLQNGGAWAISETNEQGASYSLLVEGINASDYEDYSFVAPRDMYVALCWRNTILKRPMAAYVEDVMIHEGMMTMQGGRLNPSTGYMKVAVDNRSDFMNYMHSVYFYKASDIVDVRLEDGETCNIYSSYV